MTIHRDKPLILIVEDEPKIAAVLRDYLEAAKYVTEILHDGSVVLDWVGKHQPDLVLLDLMLPGKDGLDVCREIRATSDIPIVMVTARAEEIDRLLGLELGADELMGSNGVCLIEWADRVDDVLPGDLLRIEIEIEGLDRRLFQISGSGPKSDAVVQALRDSI